MSARLVLAFVATAGILGNSVLLAGALAVRWRRTDRRWLRTGLFRWLVRAPRSWVTRYLLWWASWPHLLDRLVPPPRRPAMATPSVVVRRYGRATLSRVDLGQRVTGEPVLVVHSVVTRPWILDLLRGRSVVGALAEAGHVVYLLDWGDPLRGDGGQDLAWHVHVFAQAVNDVAMHSPTHRVQVVGYCMGATIALAAVGAWGPGPVAALALVAPPYDFEVPGGTAALVRRPLFLPVLALDGDGCVPAAYVREAFHLLRPEALKSAYRRLRRRRDVEFQVVAGALARWTWEQRRMPGALWFDLVDLMRDNALLCGTLRVGAERVDLARVTVPVMVLVTDRDHIVPIASSLALTRAIPHAEVVRCPAGHVSMLMGHECRTVTAPALIDWVRRPGALRQKFTR